MFVFFTNMNTYYIQRKPHAKCIHTTSTEYQQLSFSYLLSKQRLRLQYNIYLSGMHPSYTGINPTDHKQSLPATWNIYPGLLT